MTDSQLKTLFFKDKPLFGLDIGHATLRVMQLDIAHAKPRLKGYGSVKFDPSAITDGIISKPEVIAKAANRLFRHHLIGDISTNRVAVCLPSTRAFTRAVRLPQMSRKDMEEAVRTEAEQYIPANIDELYVDYTTLRNDADGIEVFLVAMPRAIVDSYVVLMRLLGLEPVLFDTSIGASAQLFAREKHSDVPAVLVDFGGKSTDISIFNRGLVVTGTVNLGGDDITDIIQRELHVSAEEALVLKSQYGLGEHDKMQRLIVKALEPSLEMLMKEIRRTIRYYEEHYTGEPPIGQMLIMGGGANIPGMADSLTAHMRLPTRSFDPGAHIDFDHLQPFYSADRMSYVSVAGLAVTNPKQVFND